MPRALLCLVLATSALAQESIKPTPEHEILASDAGTWDATLTSYLIRQGGEPTVHKGTEVNTLLAGFPPDAPQPPILPPRDGFLFLDRDKFHASFAGDLPETEARFMADSQVPWGVDALGGQVTRPAWRTRPSWAVIATEDKAFDQAMLLSMAKRIGADVTKVSASHAVFMTQPKVVADTIDRAAKEAGAKAKQH